MGSEIFNQKKRVFRQLEPVVLDKQGQLIQCAETRELCQKKRVCENHNLHAYYQLNPWFIRLLVTLTIIV